MAVQRRVPVEDAITYIEFTLSDSAHPFVAVSSVSGGSAVLEEIIPRGEAGYAEFFSVMNTDPDEVLAIADAHGSVDAKLLARHGEGGLFEFVVKDDCPAVFLGEEGALPRQVESVDGEGRIAAEVPAAEDVAPIVERFLEAFPDADLVSKRRQPYTTPMFSHREFATAIEDHLTDRQREILAAAHEAGYYSWPRETTGEDLAESLGISPSTLHQHLRVAESKLIQVFFQDPSVGTTGGPERSGTER